MRKLSRLLILSTALGLLACGNPQPAQEEAATTAPASDLKRGLTTVVDYDKVYNKEIGSLDEARRAITEYGDMQRAKCDNPEVIEIEKQLQQDYDIISVNLGEIDVETARDIQRACEYMFDEYPAIRGTLTSISIGNFSRESSNIIAVTETREFMINENYGQCPFVVKYAINLNASKFFDRDGLLKTCEEMVESGHWPQDTDISTIVVHELGHQVLNAIAMKEYGLYESGQDFTGYYVTQANIDSYGDYLTDQLSANQVIPQKVLDEAYEIWINDYEGTGSDADFRASISEYAAGIQDDGGISYPETVAEAVADVYLHGDEASKASLAIVRVLKQY